jgi:membrane protease YdiL (CAAX protease family)
MGSRAVIVSTIPFVIMHFGKPQPEVYGSLAAGFILCWLALRSNSIWPGVLLHWLVATSMDVFAAF